MVDLVKDHLIPHIAPLKTTKEMYDALTGLFEINNPSRKRALRNQLRDIKMTRSDTIATYFMKVSQLRDQLLAIGETVDEGELVSIALNGLPTSWEPFIQGVCARSELPGFDRLWIDCVQEEGKLLS